MNAADKYLYDILVREHVDTGPTSAAIAVQATLMTALREWAGNNLNDVHPSGSFAKGTANKSGTDVDLFISLLPSTPHTLKEIYEALGVRLRALKYAPRAQNVSWNIQVDGLSVDLVPAKLQTTGSTDHSLFRRRANTWTKTNVETHISTVRSARRTGEARLVKLWRDQHGLEFPSFYIELAVIEALGVSAPGQVGGGSWEGNMQAVFEYLRDKFEGARIEDPANSSNVISDDLSAAEKGAIQAAADRARRAANWNEIIR